MDGHDIIAKLISVLLSLQSDKQMLSNHLDRIERDIANRAKVSFYSYYVIVMQTKPHSLSTSSILITIIIYVIICIYFIINYF